MASPGPRRATVRRTTRETQIELTLDLDGAGQGDISTGVGFFDHMLTHVATHGLFDLSVKAQGDLHVDDHHTVEDVMLCLGEALEAALGDKAGIRRYGHAVTPMDEALAEAAVDLSGRPAFVLVGELTAERIGTFDGQLVEEAFKSLAMRGRLALHVTLRHGHNAHHLAEAAFKAVGRALRQAVEIDPRRTGVPSTKGML